MLLCTSLYTATAVVADTRPELTPVPSELVMQQGEFEWKDNTSLWIDAPHGLSAGIRPETEGSQEGGQQTAGGAEGGSGHRGDDLAGRLSADGDSEEGGNHGAFRCRTLLRRTVAAAVERTVWYTDSCPLYQG